MKVVKIIFRILVSPLFLILFLLFSIKNSLVMTYKCIKYGSEIIPYDKDLNPETFGLIVWKIIQENKKNEIQD